MISLKVHIQPNLLTEINGNYIETFLSLENIEYEFF